MIDQATRDVGFHEEPVGDDADGNAALPGATQQREQIFAEYQRLTTQQ